MLQKGKTSNAGAGSKTGPIELKETLHHEIKMSKTKKELITIWLHLKMKKDLGQLFYQLNDYGKL